MEFFETMDVPRVAACICRGGVEVYGPASRHVDNDLEFNLKQGYNIRWEVLFEVICALM